MKKNVLMNIPVMMLALILASCSNLYSKNDTSLSVHLCARSKNGSEIEFKVYPENQDGMVATGAAVCVVDENSIVTALDFDSDSQCFTGYVDSAGSKFCVRTRSILSDDVVSMDIVHRKLTEKPTLTAFCDSDGNDALSADSLDPSCEIQAAWKSLGDGVVYTATVVSGGNTVWARSTNAQTVTIPAGTLASGKTCYLKVSAQLIDGDPYYIDSDYYSVSEYSGSSISFSTSK